MHRFFITPEHVSDATIIALPKPIAHQVRDVLHLAIGEQLLLLDNSGDEILATVVNCNRNTVDVQLLERRPGKSEPTVHIILCQGLLKSARFEWVLEKGTELGVSTFVPTLCRRSMAGLEDAGPSKTQRWQRIIQEAAEQSGRSRLPTLLPIRPLIHTLNDIPPGALAIMPWEEEHHHTLREALTTKLHSDHSIPTSSTGSHDTVGADLSAMGAINRRVAGTAHTPNEHQPSLTIVLFIGPEGGLTPDEATLAQHYGVHLVTLGSRILRAETAALATIANVMYELT